MSFTSDVQALDKYISKMKVSQANTLIGSHTSILTAYRSYLSKVYEEYSVDGVLRYEDMLKYNRLQSLLQYNSGLVQELYSKNTKELNNYFKELVSSTNLTLIDSLETHTDKKLASKLSISDTSTISDDDGTGITWKDRMTKHRNDTIYDLNNNIATGIRTGLPYIALISKIKTQLGKSAYKSSNLMKVQSDHVYSTATKSTLDKANENNIGMTKTWITANDEDVRATHRPMHGVTIPYDGYFKLPDGTSFFLPHLSGLAEHDINCRCTVSLKLISY